MMAAENGSAGASRPRLRTAVIACMLSAILSLAIGLTAAPMLAPAPSTTTNTVTATIYRTTTTVKMLSPYLHADGSLILDGNERPVWLHGANVAGNMKYHDLRDYQNLAGLGFNVVRLPIYWSKLEPEPGHYDEEYLTYIDRDIGWAGSLGMYVVLDIHQYFWASRFPTDEGCCGSGLPLWAVGGYDGTREGRNAAVTMFWNNASLRTSFVELWMRLAARYRNNTAVAGYDIFNEPLAGNVPIREFGATVLPAFYSDVIAGIRKVDPYHMVFYEAPFEDLYRPIFVNATNVVFSPHFYIFAFAKYYDAQEENGLLPRVMNGTFRVQTTNITVPVWVGEFGTVMSMPGWQGWVRQALRIFAQRNVGWSWWAYQRDDTPGMAMAYENGTLKADLAALLTDPGIIPSQSSPAAYSGAFAAANYAEARKAENIERAFFW